MPASPSLLRHLLHDGLVTAAFCCAIALALTLGGHGRWDVQLAYSLAIGLPSWLIIEAGRFALSGGSNRWPRGWRGVLLVLAGSGCGLVLGTLLGDAYSGHAQPLWSSPWLPSTLVITLLAAAAISFFFHSRAQAQQLALQAAQAQRDAAQARLALLQAQLEPHMLFNTLANLRVLIATDAPRAQAMLDHLIDYLRATLGASRATPLHPLREEFARLADYLALIAVRMGPRLRFSLDLPAPLAPLPVPALVLQPLVENAIRHGLEPCVEGGTVRVQARLLEGGARLQLTVHDSGAGLGGASQPTEGGTHFGLSQVRERLATLYGAAGTLELAPGPEGGTLATVTLPLPTP